MDHALLPQGRPSKALLQGSGPPRFALKLDLPRDALDQWRVTQAAQPDERRAALAAAIAAGVIWGILPLVMQAIAASGPGALEILGHRVVWGVPAVGVLVVLAGQGAQVARILRQPRTLGWLALSSALVAANWISFIWASTNSRVLEASLGQYILPLTSMAAGALVFRERMGRLSAVAITLAAAGVAVQTLALGRLPWIALGVALPFAAYSVVRKRVAAEAQAGLFVECLIMLVPALVLLAWLQVQGHSHFLKTGAASLWLVAAGPITASPLALFAWATRRLTLTAMGFLQFLSPTISFLVGIFQHEPFHLLNALAFVFIWTGLALFVAGEVRKARADRAAGRMGG